MPGGANTWKLIGSQHRYGLELVNLWQSMDDPNEVFFLLDVADVDRANAFMARPESRETGEKSGEIDGSFHFLRPA